MDPQLRAIIDKIKADMVAQAAGAHEANKHVPVSGTRHDLPLKGRTIDMVYYAAAEPNAPLLLGFHGGGYLFGGSALDDAMWCAVRDALGVNVASIGYRLTPDYRYPAPVEDAYDAAIYLKAHAGEFSFDPARMMVGGCSAGGNISAAACIMAKEKGGVSFTDQILIYPELDNASDPGSKGEGSLGGPMLYVFGELYLVPGRESEPCCSPICAKKEELEGLPHAIIVTADNDSLKAEALTYADMLREAGVPVDATTIEGTPHGYFEYGFGTAMGQDFLDEGIKAQIADGTIPAAARKTLDFIKAALG